MLPRDRLWLAPRASGVDHASVSANRRWHVLAGAALTVAFVLVRIEAARTQAIALTEPEELLNLRFARQLLGGHAIGPLGQYWYTGVGGPGGAGTLVLSILYVPFVALLGPGVWAVRAMGIAWAVVGALLTAGLSRRLFGPPGFLAGLLAALAMPPAWVGFTVMAKGNYVEAAVLTMAVAYALLRAGDADSRLGPVWAVVAGGVATFSVWFWPSAGPPSALLGGALLVLAAVQRRPTLVIGFVAGAVLGLIPGWMGVEPVAAVASQVGTVEIAAVAREVLAAPNTWSSIVHGSLAGQPLLSLPTAPAWEWAAGWQIATENSLRGLLWAACIAAVVSTLIGPIGRRTFPEWNAPRRLILGCLALASLGLPVLLGVIGVGPDYLPVRSLYFFDPRRAALVYLVWALATAGVFVAVWNQQGLVRTVGLVIFLGFWLLQVASAITFAMHGRAPEAGFHPERWIICPEATPVEEVAVCVGTVDHSDVPVLAALTAVPELLAPRLRRAALLGYGTVEREERGCEIAPGTLPAESPPGARGETEWMWHGFGIAARGVCSIDVVRELCAEPTEAGLRAACERGAEWRGALR